MTAQAWKSLRTKKYQLSLRLFLFLNLCSAFFSLLNPLYSVYSSTLPVVFLAAGSGLLLLWHWRFPQKKINILFISLAFGCLWAWHVGIKTLELPSNNTSYVMIALLTILFIGTISFSNNIRAFTLNALPIVITCLAVTHGEQWVRMLYCFALPLVGVSIHYIIQKRNDTFAQELMFQLIAERETLNDLSMLDPLTGLYNRRGLQHRLDTQLALNTEDHYVMLLDIDHFKAYNDHYGHMMGDKALIRVSAAIRNAVRSRDIVARYGGEEFMVVLPQSDAQSAMRTAERIRQQVYDLKIPHMFNESVATNVTISIGIAPLITDNVELALEKADRALYEAKHMGRNNILTSEALQPA
ncbi:GGDEF domain-containing protein [Trabulsiella odontotermitis]|uniref:diguanylate cyclase n=1 Tax=Trabulsiella odontotermitis TaxID=379893 RepID=A0A0L0GJ09_9ENTR|nr:GGDEF domain-containing protein [Trabulsiella odontotermitis]KNC89100.1 diguanylate cyclase [Trabulsiella odontotermitis]KNC89282.1 diguanylate cyclase [Trabulsiella odontotermitis]